MISCLTSQCSYPIQWQNNREALESSGERVMDALRKATAISAHSEETLPSALDVAHRCFQQLSRLYEEEYGGFSDAPKFPTPGKRTPEGSEIQNPRAAVDERGFDMQMSWVCTTQLWCFSLLY